MARRSFEFRSGVCEYLAEHEILRSSLSSFFEKFLSWNGFSSGWEEYKKPFRVLRCQSDTHHLRDDVRRCCKTVTETSLLIKEALRFTLYWEDNVSLSAFAFCNLRMRWEFPTLFVYPAKCQSWSEIVGFVLSLQIKI